MLGQARCGKSLRIVSPQTRSAGCSPNNRVDTALADTQAWDDRRIGEIALGKPDAARDDRREIEASIPFLRRTVAMLAVEVRYLGKD